MNRCMRHVKNHFEAKSVGSNHNAQAQKSELYKKKYSTDKPIIYFLPLKHSSHLILMLFSIYKTNYSYTCTWIIWHIISKSRGSIPEPNQNYLYSSQIQIAKNIRIWCDTNMDHTACVKEVIKYPLSFFWQKYIIRKKG